MWFPLLSFPSSCLAWFYLKAESCATLSGRASLLGGDEVVPWDPRTCNRPQHVGEEKLIALSSGFSIPSTRHYNFHIRNQYVAQGEVRENPSEFSESRPCTWLWNAFSLPPRGKVVSTILMGKSGWVFCTLVLPPISNICNAFPIPAASQVTPCNYIPNCATVVLSGMLHCCLIYKCQFGSTIQWEITHIRHRAAPTYE